MSYHFPYSGGMQIETTMKVNRLTPQNSDTSNKSNADWKTTHVSLATLMTRSDSKDTGPHQSVAVEQP